MSNEMAVIEKSVLSVIEQATGLAKVHNSISIEAEKNYAIQLLYKNKMSIETAQKNPVSVQNAILNLSSIGISLNPALKHAYLVPRDGAICLDVSYMGLMHLAQEIGSIEWGQAKIVYANATYESQGLNQQPIHKFNAFSKDRGEKVGVYCTVKLPSGDFLTEEMSSEDIAEVRKTSKSQHSSYSPWNTFESEMWRKSVVKRGSKYWPKSCGTKGNRLDTAIHVINEHEGLDTEREAHLEKFISLYQSNSEPLVLWGYIEQFRENEEMSQWIYRNFPKGHKTKIPVILKEGRDLFFQYKAIFEGNEESQIEEAKSELSEIELKIIYKGIHSRKTIN